MDKVLLNERLKKLEQNRNIITNLCIEDTLSYKK